MGIISQVKFSSCLRGLIVLILVITFQPNAANASIIPINNFLVCDKASQMNCVVSLKAEFEDGTIVDAIPTGIVRSWESKDFEQNVRTYSAVEWKISGLKSSSGSNTVVTQIWMPKPVATQSGTDFGALDLTIFASLFDSPQDELNPILCHEMNVITSCLFPPQFMQKVRFTVVLNSNLLEPGLTTGSVENVAYELKEIDGGTQFMISGSAMVIPVNLPDQNNTAPGDFKKSLGNRTYWHLGTIDRRNREFDWAREKKCSTDNPIISSNAAKAEIPEFDNISQDIKLKVSSPHFKSDGHTLEIGQFRASISLSGITCIWGIKVSAIAPQAVVNVNYQDGTTSVAALTSRTVSNNFVIEASGYTYSSPTLSLKFIDTMVPPTARNDSTTVLVSDKTKIIPIPLVSKISSNKNVAITCVKGKVTKKVMAVKPKCPAGYKKV
jgi:hypothetical protein